MAVTPLHIVAVGARTPLGLHADSSTAALRAGIRRIREHPLLLDGACKPLHCGRDSILPPDLWGSERLAVLARSAFVEAIGKLPALPREGRVAVVLTVPEGARREVLAALSDTSSGGLELEYFSAPHLYRGLEVAQQLLAQRRFTTCLVGAVDSRLDAEQLAHLASARRLASEGERSGLLPGEGAAFLALSLGAHSRLGTVAGTATVRELRSPDSDEGSLGEALTSAIATVASALSRGETFQDIFLDLNGERYRAEEWGFVALRRGALFRDATAYTLPVVSWGDAGLAAPALQLMAAAQAVKGGYARGSAVLVAGHADDTHRGAVLLRGSA